MIFIEKNKTVPVLFIILITAIVYAKLWQFGFVNFDDKLYVTENQKVIFFGFESIKFFFTQFEWGHYFPITMISYGVQAKLTGLNPGYFHLFDLLIHLTNIALVATFLRSFKLNNFVWLFTILFFALSPIQIESVAWIGTRGGILATFFSLISLIFYNKYSKTLELKFLLFSYLAFLLAVLSKSSAITIPIIFLLIDWYNGRKISINQLLEKAPAFLVSLIFAIVAILAARELGTVDQQNTQNGSVFSWYNRIFIVLYSASFYFLKSIWPSGLSAMHYDPQEVLGVLPFSYYYKWAIAVSIGTLAYFSTKHKREIIFFTAFLISNLFLVINIVPLGRTITSERYAYLPSVAVFVVVGLLLEAVIKRIRVKNTQIFILVMLAAISGYFTLNKLEVWRNTYNLFENMYKVYPNASHAINGYANALVSKGEYKKAIKLHNLALQNGKSYKYFSDRGGNYFLLDSLEKAEDDFTKAIYYDPQQPSVYLNRAYVRHKKGNFQEALKDLNIALLLNKDLKTARELRAEILIFFRDFNRACQDLVYLKKYKSKIVLDLASKFCLAENTLGSGIEMEKILHQNGKTKFEIITDSIDGLRKTYLVNYDTTGKTIEKGEIVNGKYNGKIVWYYKNGNPSIDGYYLDIFPYGNWMEYYEDGILKARYSFVSGLKDGIYEYYYPNGNIWTKKEYKKGKLIKVLELKSKNGDNLDIGSFSDGNGLLNVYNEQSIVIKTANYKDGLLTK